MSLSLDVRKRYSGFTLDMQLEAGEERVALLGASGCGKSCTLRCIAGVETPDEGRIVVNGVTFFDSARRINLSPQKRKCALLYQSYQLFPNLTVAENVCAGMDRARPAPELRALAERYLAIFGMERFAERYPAQLSGGMRQRAALIRTLAARPDILLLDEPFSALDYQTRLNVCNDVYHIIRTEKKTALLVTHDISEAISVADRVLVLSARPARVVASHPLGFGDAAPLRRREDPRFTKWFETLWRELNG